MFCLHVLQKEDYMHSPQKPSRDDIVVLLSREYIPPDVDMDIDLVLTNASFIGTIPFSVRCLLMLELTLDAEGAPTIDAYVASKDTEQRAQYRQKQLEIGHQIKKIDVLMLKLLTTELPGYSIYVICNDERIFGVPPSTTVAM